MIVRQPTYMKHFKCIADKCTHTCCRGWEIDIDDDTFMMYQGMDTPLGNDLRAAIAYDGETAHFCLTEDERCPMLLDNGLCRIICEAGEDALCQICSDHPRFYNCVEDYEEQGLGLTCEAACHLILSQDRPFTLDTIASDDDMPISDDLSEFLAIRDECIWILQDKRHSFIERMSKLFDSFGEKDAFQHTDAFLKELFQLELLDSEWTILLQKSTAVAFNTNETTNQILFMNLAVYLLYRHLLPGYEDSTFTPRLLVCLFLTLSAIHIWTVCHEEIASFEEVCRMMSSEIEYSDENMDILISWAEAQFSLY